MSPLNLPGEYAPSLSPLSHRPRTLSHLRLPWSCRGGAVAKVFRALQRQTMEHVVGHLESKTRAPWAHGSILREVPCHALSHYSYLLIITHPNFWGVPVSHGVPNLPAPSPGAPPRLLPSPVRGPWGPRRVATCQSAFVVYLWYEYVIYLSIHPFITHTHTHLYIYIYMHVYLHIPCLRRGDESQPLAGIFLVLQRNVAVA